MRGPAYGLLNISCMNNRVITAKRYISSISAFAFTVYFWGVAFSAPYFSYQDIKGHNSFFRMVFISPFVGSFKAIVWPAYAFQPNERKNSENVTAFFHALTSMEEANKIVRQLSVSSHPKQDFEKIKQHMADVERILTKCDENDLERIYPSWGKSVALFKTAVKDFNEQASQANGELVEYTDRESARLRFNVWLQQNINPLITMLSSKHYEIGSEPS